MKRFRYLLLLIPGIYFSWIAAISTRLAGGEDGVMHHLFARYVPDHQENLLDHWAKPLYVLLSAPFAQFGMYGSLLFNVLLAVLTMYFLWKTAENLGLESPWLAPAMLFSSTIYFYCIPSAVTEILFGFLLSAAFLASSRKNYSLAAALISFLPFVRSEGNGIIFIFLLGLLFMKKWKAIPWLALGTLIYSIVGSFYFDDLFWVWNNNPYHDASDIYHNGTWYHYIEKTTAIWGIPLYLLWVIGSAFMLFHAIRLVVGKEKTSEKTWFWLFFVFGSFYVYLAGHSLVWALGKSASLGLIRVMAAVMPACALIGMYAMDKILYAINPNLEKVKLGMALILFFVLVKSPIELNHPPYAGDLEKEEIQKVGAWFRSSPYFPLKAPLYYFAPSMAEEFRIDPFDQNRRKNLADYHSQDEMPQGTIVVWDGHFGPNECHLPIDTLLNNTDLEVIHHQVPEKEMKALNGYPYEIYLFRKK
ncbi:MAG: hypothetical protein GC180_11020 [Bacteroidetes bacterium]|nr:hypothetical protein [Bacteroidota bacterium]